MLLFVVRGSEWSREKKRVMHHGATNRGYRLNLASAEAILRSGPLLACLFRGSRKRSGWIDTPEQRAGPVTGVSLLINLISCALRIPRYKTERIFQKSVYFCAHRSCPAELRSID